jgi:hypothetical protein
MYVFDNTCSTIINVAQFFFLMGIMKNTFLKNLFRPGAVAQACNPSYLGGKDLED